MNWEYIGDRMKKVLLSVFVCVLLSMCLFDSGSDSDSNVNSEPPPKVTSTEKDVIYVMHFHRVQQCTCCINVGKWAEETLQEHFPDEYKEGTLIYMDVCVEENPELAAHYNAYGASLFVNVVKGGNEDIMEVMEVWGLCHNHDAYLEFFRQYIENLLGK